MRVFSLFMLPNHSFAQGKIGHVFSFVSLHRRFSILTRELGFLFRRPIKVEKLISQKRFASMVFLIYPTITFLKPSKSLLSSTPPPF